MGQKIDIEHVAFPGSLTDVINFVHFQIFLSTSMMIVLCM